MGILLQNTSFWTQISTIALSNPYTPQATSSLFYAWKEAGFSGASWSGSWVSRYEGLDLVVSLKRKQENTHCALGACKEMWVLFIFIIKAPGIFIPSCTPTLFPQMDLQLTDRKTFAHKPRAETHTRTHSRTTAMREARSDKMRSCQVNFSQCLSHLCIKSCLLLMMFLLDYVELQEWGNILNEKRNLRRTNSR